MDGASWVCDRVVLLLVDGVVDELRVEGVVDALDCAAGVLVLLVGAAVADELAAATAATATDPMAPPATRIQVMARARARPAPGR